jgi:hypothetical protein
MVVISCSYPKCGWINKQSSRDYDKYMSRKMSVCLEKRFNVKISSICSRPNDFFVEIHMKSTGVPEAAHEKRTKTPGQLSLSRYVNWLNTQN